MNADPYNPSDLPENVPPGTFPFKSSTFEELVQSQMLHCFQTGRNDLHLLHLLLATCDYLQVQEGKTPDIGASGRLNYQYVRALEIEIFGPDFELEKCSPGIGVPEGIDPDSPEGKIALAFSIYLEMAASELDIPRSEITPLILSKWALDELRESVIAVYNDSESIPLIEMYLSGAKGAIKGYLGKDGNIPTIEAALACIPEPGGQLQPSPREAKRGRYPKLPGLPDGIRSGTTTLQQGIGANLSRLSSWKPSPSESGLVELRTINTKGSAIVGTSMPSDIWSSLKGRPAEAVKAWLAMEAKRFESADPNDVFIITPEFVLKEVRDQKQKNRKFRPSEKQEAAELVKGMIELRCSHEFKGRNQKPQRVSGPYYHEVATAEGYEDLFGWVPVVIGLRFNSGLYGESQATLSKQSAIYHRQLLSLHAKNDAGAIFLGCYIVLKGRSQAQQFGPGECRFRNKNLLAVLTESGVINLKAFSGQLAQIPKKVKRDLQKLVSCGVITSWECGAKDPYEGGTIDDIEDIEEAFPDELPTTDTRRKRDAEGKLRRGGYYDWLEQTTTIHLGHAATQAQLGARANSAERKKRTRKG